MNNEHESNMTIPYVKVGDYYFPNFTLPPDAGDIGFWGRRRREFLREHRPITFNQLVLSGELFKYLALFNQEAIERLERLIQAIKVAQGITEGALALYEGDAEPLHRLGMKNNEEVSASAFDTIGTALYDLCERIASMQHHHIQETIHQSDKRKTKQRASPDSKTVGRSKHR